MSIEIIREIFNSVPGMITEEEALFLYELAAKCRKGVIVEIGSNAGRSTICLAKGSKISGGMPVYSIDPHNGGGATPDPTWYDMSHEGTPDIKYYINQGSSFLPFQQRLKEHHVDDIVVTLIDYSELIYKRGWYKPIELLFIDADHRFNYVKMDYDLWSKHVVSGGKILLHDSSYVGVRRVINELILPNSKFIDIKELPIFNVTVK